MSQSSDKFFKALFQ